jgi:regulator of nonsense transcripts 2
LHQRFGAAFTPPLTINILRALAPANPQQLASLSADQRDKEESARLVRQRVFLRVTTELWLVGIIRSVSDATAAADTAKSSTTKTPAKGKKTDVETDTSPLPLAVLKELLGKDKDHVNLPLLVAFTKNFAYDVLGVKQTNVKKPVDVTTKEGVVPQAVSLDEPLCPQELQEQFRTIVMKYFASVKNHIFKSHMVQSCNKV